MKVKISFAIYEKTSVTTSISSEALKYLNRDIKTRALPTDCLESEKEGTMGCFITLVPKVLLSFLFSWRNNFWDFFSIFDGLDN